MRIAGLAFALGLVACGPTPTASERQAETNERMALANSIRTVTVRDWKAASTLQRMAAADTMAISLLMNRGIARPSNSQIDPLSAELRACLDEATQAQGMDSQPLPDFAAICLMGMGASPPR